MIHRMLKTIPDETVVCAQSDLVPHLSHREKIFVFPLNWRVADYVFLDLYSTSFPVSANQYRRQVRQVFLNSRMGILEYNDGILLFKRDYPNTLNETIYKVFLPLINHTRTSDGRAGIPKGRYVVPLNPIP